MMRSSICLSFLLFASTSHAAPSDDPVGAWKINLASPDGKSRECVIVISREGKALKGTCSTNGVKMPVKDTVFDQGVLIVRVDGEYVGQVYALTYKGKPLGDTFHGTADWSYGWASGRIPFRGERILPVSVAAP